MKMLYMYFALILLPLYFGLVIKAAVIALEGQNMPTCQLWLMVALIIIDLFLNLISIEYKD